MSSLAALLAATLAAQAGGASDFAPASAPEPLTSALWPVWSVEVPAGVEWCELATVGGREVLAVCDAAARALLLDAASGAGLLREALELQPGARFAGTSGEVMYFFSRSFVYAVKLEGQAPGGTGGSTLTPAAAPRAPEAKLIWTAKAALNPPLREQGDPEWLRRVVAAAACPDGVLLVRDDGAIAELDCTSGQARWEVRSPAFASVELHVEGSRAAILGRRGGEWSVGFIDLTQRPPHVVWRSFEREPPVAAALVEGTLYVHAVRYLGAITSDGSVLRDWSGGAGRFFAIWRPPGGQVAVGARAGQAHSRPGKTDRPGTDPPRVRPDEQETDRSETGPPADSAGAGGIDGSGRGPRVICLTEQGWVEAHDLPTGQTVRYPAGMEAEVWPVARTVGFFVSDEYIVWFGGGQAVFLGAEDGRVLARLTGTGSVLAATVRDGDAYALLHPAEGGSEELTLYRQSLPGRAAGDGVAPPAPLRYRVRADGPVRGVRWTGRGAVLVLDRGLRGLELP